MNLLEEIISSLTKEELRYFKLFSARVQYEKDRKDLILFEAILRAGDAYDEDKLFKELYAGKDKNGFYRLKNRLMQEVNKSLLVLHLEDDMVKQEYLFSLYKLFLQKGLKDVAAYFLSQAEKFALGQEDYARLDYIYSEAITFSTQWAEINPAEYIKKRADNAEKLQKIREMDQVLAVINYELKMSQNYKPAAKSMMTLLQQITKKYSNDKNLLEDMAFQQKIFRAVSMILLQKKDYQTLFDYSHKTYQDYKSKRQFKKSNHDFKLLLLTYCVNASFKLYKHEDSLGFAEELRKGMEEYDGMLMEKYSPFYENALVINYSKTHPAKAIEILRKKKQGLSIPKMSIYDVYIYLNLALCYFTNARYDEAIKEVIAVKMLPLYKKIDELLRLKIDIAELIIRFEMSDLDIIEYRIKQIQREFKSILLEESSEREQVMIKLISGMSKFANYATRKNLETHAQQMISEGEGLEEGADIIDYDEWLKTKFKHLGA